MDVIQAEADKKFWQDIHRYYPKKISLPLHYVIITDTPNVMTVQRSNKQRKPRAKYADRKGIPVTICLWEDEYEVLLRYARDIAKIRGMPKRLPLGETIAYIIRYFGVANRGAWDGVLRIAKDEQEDLVDHRRFLDTDRKRQSRAKTKR
jgi:hypothetical protein